MVRPHQFRFRTLIFWVYEPMENLRPRLDQRVDKMVHVSLSRGAKPERAESITERTFRRNHTASRDSEGVVWGCFGCGSYRGYFPVNRCVHLCLGYNPPLIRAGYKEFASLQLPQTDPTRDPAFPSMLARMKLSTHQYAKSQLKWIRKQLLPAVREAKGLGGDVAVYVVHGGERGETVAKDVLAGTFATCAVVSLILSAFLMGEALPDPNTVGHPDAPELLALLQDMDGSRVPDTVG